MTDNTERRKFEAREELDGLYDEFMRDPMVQLLMTMIPQSPVPELLPTLVKAALSKGFGAGQGNMIKEFMILTSKGDKK